MPEITYAALKEVYKRETGLIFHTSVGTPYSPRNILRHFHALLKSMDLPRMPFHNLRHTCASFHLAAGTNPKVVQEILGHSSVTVTLSTYSHLLSGVTEEATRKINNILGV
jgi:integrase